MPAVMGPPFPTKSLLKNYTKVRHIGHGSFGTVHECADNLTGKKCALKQILVTEDNYERQMREAEILRHISEEPHPNLLRMYHAWIETDVDALAAVWQPAAEQEIAMDGGEELDETDEFELSSWGTSTMSASTWASSLVSQFSNKDALLSSGCKLLCIHTELYTGGSLHAWLHSTARNSSTRSRFVDIDIFEQVTAATAHLHALGIVHRDIKPANIFLEPKVDEPGKYLRAILGDLGQGRFLHEIPMRNCHSDSMLSTCTIGLGSPQYSSPELRDVDESIRSGYFVGTSTDVYSLGVVLYEIAAKFTTMMERAQVSIFTKV